MIWGEVVRPPRPAEGILPSEMVTFAPRPEHRHVLWRRLRAQMDFCQPFETDLLAVSRQVHYEALAVMHDERVYALLADPVARRRQRGGLYRL